MTRSTAHLDLVVGFSTGPLQYVNPVERQAICAYNEDVSKIWFLCMYTYSYMYCSFCRSALFLCLCNLKVMDLLCMAHDLDYCVSVVVGCNIIIDIDSNQTLCILHGTLGLIWYGSSAR